jgi:hypothetical protein
MPNFKLFVSFAPFVVYLGRGETDQDWFCAVKLLRAGCSRFGVLFFWHQGTGGAHVGAGTALVTGDIGRISATEKSDHRVEASVGKGQKVVVILFPTNVNALAAKHTAERIIGEESEVDFLFHISL